MTYLVPTITTQPTDYTPTIAFGGSFNGSYNANVGQWFQMGNIIMFYIGISVKTLGSTTGNATITLPFTTSSSMTTGTFAPAYFGLSLTSGYSPMALITPGTNTIFLYQQNGSYTALTQANFAVNSQVILIGWFAL